MPELTLYHIEPKGAFHLGQRGIGQEETAVTIGADRLFAALILSWVELGHNPDEVVQAFPRTQNGKTTTATPPFLLTSAFPRVGAVRFYPAQLTLLARSLTDENTRAHIKELKRIQFVSEAIFRRAVQGESLDDWLPPQKDGETGPGVYWQNKALWLTAAEAKQAPPDNLVWKTDKVPRVTVDRMRNASNIFQTGRVVFNVDCGLWFGIAWLQPDLQPAVMNIFQILGDAGLGGERAVGYGQFTLSATDKTESWADPAPDGAFVTLSRYHPCKDELPNALRGEATGYKLTPVSGWLQASGTAAQRRRRIHMIAEGSIVQAVEKSHMGDIVDVRPHYANDAEPFAHPVWRYGLACPVAIQGG